MNDEALDFWDQYIETLTEKPISPNIEVGISGNIDIADELLCLYLSGKKTAGSSLVKDYELAGDPLPKIGDYWIILNSLDEPKCIVKTVRVEHFKFSDVPEEVAVCEGEGDLSVEYWKKAHVDFFTPFLEAWGVSDLGEETVVTEFYEIVYKSNKSRLN